MAVSHSAFTSQTVIVALPRSEANVHFTSSSKASILSDLIAQAFLDKASDKA